MRDRLESRVTAVTGSEAVETTELDGGMIGRVHRVDLADGRSVVAKTGSTPLDVEGEMLRYLRTESDLPVPEVYHVAGDLLVMEYVEGSATVTPAVQRDAADHLAALHARSARGYGFQRDTLTGPLRQPNEWTDSWVTFFREQRVRYVARRARTVGHLSSETYDRVTALAADLDDLLVEPAAPALLHGDVWRTNLVTDGERVRAFLDPAVYYGHHEVELAYVDWTGTFGEPFFDRYREHRTIADGFDRRKRVYALYPLLVHVRLFEGRYRDELDATLRELGY